MRNHGVGHVMFVAREPALHLEVLQEDPKAKVVVIGFTGLYEVQLTGQKRPLVNEFVDSPLAFHPASLRATTA